MFFFFLWDNNSNNIFNLIICILRAFAFSQSNFLSSESSGHIMCHAFKTLNFISRSAFLISSSWLLPLWYPLCKCWLPMTTFPTVGEMSIRIIINHLKILNTKCIWSVETARTELVKKFKKSEKKKGYYRIIKKFKNQNIQLPYQMY